MSRLPSISIITPTLNQAHYIETTILSVLNQDYQGLEHIVIDGGSTDGSIEIIRSYEEAIAYWTNEPGLGQTDALNEGLRVANGEIIGWINSDDFYLPGAISAAAHFFEQHHRAVILYGDFYEIDDAGYFLRHVRPGAFNLERLLYRCYFGQMALFFRKEPIEKIGKFNNQFMYAHDYDLWLRSGLAYSDQIHYLPKALACYRIHSKALSWTKALPARIEDIKVRESFFKLNNLPQHLLDIKENIFLDLLADLIIFYTKDYLQAEVQAYLCTKIRNDILPSQHWTMLRRFLCDKSCSHDDARGGVSALYVLSTAWCESFRGPSLAQNRSSCSQWISKLLIQLGHAHFGDKHFARTIQITRLAIALWPAILLKERTLRLILKLFAGKRLIDYLGSLFIIVRRRRHRKVDGINDSEVERFF